MEKQTKIVVILGMHRSGTSMIGGVLKTLGVNLGEDSPGRQISNPLGHFEDGDFLDLNCEILKAGGGSWDKPPNQKQIQLNFEKYKETISDLLDRRNRDNAGKCWGWKDPRTCLTLDLYAPFLKNPYYIWVERKPEDIAKSLLKRNNIPINEGLKLVKNYQGRIHDFFARNPESHLLKISYQQVLKDPDRWVDHLVKFLDLNSEDTQVKQAIQFVLPRHQLKREKIIFQLKYYLSLPYRALMRLINNK